MFGFKDNLTTAERDALQDHQDNTNMEVKMVDGGRGGYCDHG